MPIHWSTVFPLILESKKENVYLHPGLEFWARLIANGDHT